MKSFTNSILVCLIGAGCAAHAYRRSSIPVVTPLVSHVSQAISPLVSPLLISKPTELFRETFDSIDATRWREVEVKGQTRYTIEQQGDSKSLKAESQSGASILLCPFRFDPDTYDWLSWRWRVDRLVEQEDLRRKKGSDAAARVYVYFDTTGVPWQKRNIDYVWSANLPVGTVLPSAFSKSSMMIVVESGADHLGTWQTVSRDLKEDYRRCFGQGPPDVVAIGVMSDSDNTKGQAIAYFDDLVVTRNKPSQQTFGRLP